MHGYRVAGPGEGDYLQGGLGVYGVEAADGYHKRVCAFDELQLRFVRHVAQVAQVHNGLPVRLYLHDKVAAALSAQAVVVKTGYGGEFHAAKLIFPGAVYYEFHSFDSLCKAVVVMSVAHGQYIRSIA